MMTGDGDTNLDTDGISINSHEDNRLGRNPSG